MNKIRNLDILIEMALLEDLDDIGDVTSLSIFPENKNHGYSLIAKDKGVLCGIEIFQKVFNAVDNKVEVHLLVQDGDTISPGDVVAHICGPVRSILKSERTALNFLSHLSGISTKTSIFVEAAGENIKILDTRKTLPGYRELQKYAVRCGGGSNHRMGLYDMVMIKDNHIDAAGSISSAVNNVRKLWNNKYRIEVESRNIQEVQEALECEVDRIMLDNMTNEDMALCIDEIAGRAEIEASGNMTIERLNEIKKMKIDYVSFGELTHTVKVFDFSLKENK